jgi:hypothetical protein
MTTDEQIAWLTEQLNQVVAELIQTQEELRMTKGELQSTQEELQTTHQAEGAAQVQIAGLQKVKTPPPAFVKAKKKKPQAQEKKPRKKRETQYNRARKRSVPTHIVEHRIVACPDCHLRLGGISLARCREIIDVPPPPAVEVTEHRMYKGWCTGCQQWHEAPVDFSKQVGGAGTHRRATGQYDRLLAHGDALACAPASRCARRRCRALKSVWGNWWNWCIGSRSMRSQCLQVGSAEIRASPAIQADETGWREDGINGYIWSVSTPTVRYDE